MYSLSSSFSFQICLLTKIYLSPKYLKSSAKVHKSGKRLELLDTHVSSGHQTRYPTLPSCFHAHREHTDGEKRTEMGGSSAVQSRKFWFTGNRTGLNHTSVNCQWVTLGNSLKTSESHILFGKINKIQSSRMNCVPGNFTKYNYNE